MKQTIFKTVLFLLVSVTLISCSSKVKIEISFDPEQKGILVFDKKDTVKISGDSTLVYSIEAGKHTFVLNKGKEQTITITENGGILNLNKNRFVRFYENYSDESLINLQEQLKSKIDFYENDVVIIDSTVYVYKEDSTAVVSDEQIKASIENYQDTRENKANFKLYQADLFIPNDWDYGLTQDFPDNISVSSSNSSLYASEVRTKVIEEKLFVLMAMLTPDHFIIREQKEIMSNSTDKKTDSEKKQKQMEF